MTYDPNNLPATYTHTPGETLQEAAHPDLHEDDREEIRGIKNAWGLTPTSGEDLPYVRLGNAAADPSGRGLWVPAGFFAQDLLVNGNFDHWQSGSGTLTHTTTYSVTTSYGADQWAVLPAGASVTGARSSTVPNARSQYSLLVTGAASVTTCDVLQRIPADVVIPQATQSLVFSARIRNTTGASFTPNLQIGTPAALNDFTTVTTRLDQALQACAAGAWTHVYHVFDPTAYTNLANGMQAAIRFPNNALSSGAKSINIAQVSLRPWVGAARPPFLPPFPTLELLRAQRFYWKTFPQGTTPAQNVGSVLGALQWLAPNTQAGAVEVAVGFPVVMVKSPTMTFYGPFEASTTWTTGASSAGSLASAVAGVASDRGFTVYATSGGTAGNIYSIHATANARL